MATDKDVKQGVDERTEAAKATSASTKGLTGLSFSRVY